MFYLETKDGDRFFTSADSDDKIEFEKIIEAKLGEDAANMFNLLVEDATVPYELLLDDAGSRLQDSLRDLDYIIDEKDLDKLQNILSELQSICDKINLGC